MSSNIINKTSKPNIESTIKNIIRNHFEKYHFHKIGIIQSINGHYANVKIVHQKKDGEVINEYPLLIKCPVIKNYNQTGGMKNPIKIGDNCIILFNDVDIDKWYIGENNSLPSSRIHHIHDGIVLPFIFPNSINDTYNNDKTTIFYQESKIDIESSKILIDSQEIDIKSTLGGEINIKDKIIIKNQIQSLKTILDLIPDTINILIDTIKTIQAIDTVTLAPEPLTAASINALDNIKAQFILIKTQIALLMNV